MVGSIMCVLAAVGIFVYGLLDLPKLFLVVPMALAVVGFVMQLINLIQVRPSKTLPPRWPY